MKKSNESIFRILPIVVAYTIGDIVDFGSLAIGYEIILLSIIFSILVFFDDFLRGI